jgi:heme-degrading monooxygenase HmoA
MILRVWRGKVARGKADAFRRLLFEVVLPLMKNQPGMLDCQVGQSAGEPNDEFIMISSWESLERIAAFTGKDWDALYIIDDALRMLKKLEVEHYNVIPREA